MSKEYYCHSCGHHLGLIPDPPTGKLVSTPYQYDKHIKHTIPADCYSIQSCFSDGSTSEYADHIVNAMLEGAVEVDEQGRINIVWCAGRQTGFRYVNGHLSKPVDAVKVVLTSSTGEVHAFPESSTSFINGTCGRCGSGLVR